MMLNIALVLKFKNDSLAIIQTLDQSCYNKEYYIPNLAQFLSQKQPFPS